MMITNLSSKTEMFGGIVMEHRQQRRHRAFTLAEIKVHSQNHMTGLVYNVSRDGIFVLSTIAPKVNIVVDICILLPEKRKLLVPISGIIVHRSKNGFGLMFCEQRRATRIFVDKLLSSNMEINSTE